jgi:hypothetical protein
LIFDAGAEPSLRPFIEFQKEPEQTLPKLVSRPVVVHASRGPFKPLANKPDPGARRPGDRVTL